MEDKKESILKKCISYFDKAKIILTEEEKNKIKIVDFGLGRIHEIGLQLLTSVDMERGYALKN